MNIVRRLLSSTGGSLEGGEQESDQHSNPIPKGSTIKTPEQELLGLNHLKKLHADYVNSPIQANEKEDKLYAMMPLFCNVFSSVGPKVISERFGDEVQSFTAATSRLLVTEVRRRASNQSTEEAAAAIATFMEIDTSGGGNGWHLLSTLSFLVAEGDALAEIMTDASLPSTLVKCLYLFFDLPVLESNPESTATTTTTRGSTGEDGASAMAPSSQTYSPKERRLLLQKMFIQVLLKLCTYQPAVEELARKDDLTLLFSAVTSECPSHNVMWRKTAADILLTISRHSLSQPVISYLHAKGCLSLCVENMQRNANVSPLETVEMFVTVFCFLKDSAQNSETLLEDFRTCQGYIFLSDFLLRIDSTADEESHEALRNLVLLVASLTFCGHSELKMPSTIASATLYQLESFEQPDPINRGSTVRNLLAFQVLQTVFLKSNADYLDSIILDAVSTIYSADNANYFLSENLSFLPQCAEKISMKSSVVQEKFFHLIDFLIHQLKYVPCKELISVSLILKGQKNQDCCLLAIRSLISMIKFDPIFKNVLREVGMLEALIGCLSSFTERTKEEGKAVAKTYGEAIVAALTELICGNNQNATVYREAGGVSTILVLANISSCRELAVGLLQQIVLASCSEQDMTLLLELVQSAQDYEARNSFVSAVVTCLRESHRCRATFRRCGGFSYLISILLSLDQCLSFKDKSESDLSSILFQLRSVFNCLTVSMRYEPANAKYFQVEIASGNSLLQAVQLIGCFSSHPSHAAVAAKMATAPNEQHVDIFRQAFSSDIQTALQQRQQSRNVHPELNASLFYACLVLRMLYDVAIDGYEKTVSVSAGVSTSSSRSSESDETRLDSPREANNALVGRRKPIPSLNLLPPPPEPVIVHPSIVNVMLQLLPTLRIDKEGEDVDAYAVALQVFMSEVIQSLLRSEKNQQVMCDVQFLSKILVICKAPLEDESHVLHSPFQYLLERLSAQMIESSDLRTFLRLSNPLACLPHGERKRTDQAKIVPLSRIKTIVAMTTPRDLQVQSNSILPPFIELDMAAEGFGCLFLPSMAPTSGHSASVVGVSSLASQESSVSGGIGSGDRAFPPQPGISFSTWICVDKFSDPRTDPHPVRLLTIARTVRENQKEETYVCLAVALSARDKALIVSTNEVPLSKSCDWQPDFTSDHGARIWFPDLIREGEWHHVVIVINRQVLKNSSFSLFVNGQHIATQKMQFISPVPGGGSLSSGNLTMASTVFAYIGTPPHWRRQSRLCWKQGPCLLLEDIVSPQLAGTLYKLGPHYLGSLQAPQIAATGEVLSSQIAEEKIVFGLNAVAVTQLTLARIKKIYSKVDNKAIARHLGMGTGENATPINILHNSAGHLMGPARTLGGVIIGYLGARVFNPQPFSKVIETVGGCHVMLGLIAMAHNMESLYAGCKALVCVMKSNPFARMQMEENKGYQTLAMLLRKKAHLLNAHILHLMFTMSGTLDANGKEVVGIPNKSAFRDVLCDLDLWHAAPTELEKSLFEHFNELICDAGSKRSLDNIKFLREVAIVEKMLSILKKMETPKTSSTNTLLKVIHQLLCTAPRVSDVLCFALFTVSTLEICENEKVFEKQLTSYGTELADDVEITDENLIILNKIVVRNRCLRLFHALLYTEDEGEVHGNYCEDVAQVVGFDWVLLFLQGHLHHSTIVWGMKILSTLLSLPALMAKFRNGTCNGHWLLKSENVLHNKMIEALGQGPSSSKVSRANIRHDIFQVPGFQHLNWLITNHIEIPQTYFLLAAILVNRHVKELPEQIERLDLDSLWQFLFGTRASDVKNQAEIYGKIVINGDVLVTVLLMVRTLLSSGNGTKDNALPDWLQDYPSMLTQFLFFLYHNVPDFMLAFMSSEVLTALVGTLFPVGKDEEAISGGSSQTASPEEEEADKPFSQQQGAEDVMLANHPAKKNVVNFMRTIIVDSLSLLSSPKNPPVIDLLLDAEPHHTNESQRSKFQTELLTVIMDHLLAADVLIGDQAALSIAIGGNAQYIAPNVFYLASRLVDKLWQGVFRQSPDDVFQFILKLIAQAKRRSGGSSLSLEGIYRSLNRNILYMLSRPHSNVAGQMGVLEVLHKIVDNRSIIFGAGNHELEFFGSLTFCLLRLSAGKNIPLEPEGKTTWHVTPNNLQDIAPGEPANLHQGQNLLVNAATRVWDLMYVSKKPALEEAFKTSFGQQNATPPLESIRGNVYEAASKLWFNYIDQEKKGATFAKVPPWEFHTQLQSRIQRVTGGFAGGLRRLTSVGGQGGAVSSHGDTRGKKEETTKVELSSIPLVCFLQSTSTHVSFVKEVVEHHFRTRQQTDQHMLTFIEEEWLRTESLLTQERGVWGPFTESHLTKWMLDMTEGPSRMRRRLIRNDIFYLNYPYQRRRRRTTADDRDVVDERPLKYKRPTSHDSQFWYEQHQPIALLESLCDEHDRIVEEYDDCDISVSLHRDITSIDEEMRKIGFKAVSRTKSDSFDKDEDPAEEDSSERQSSGSLEVPTSPSNTTASPAPVAESEECSSDYQTVMRLLEQGEKISQMFRCARIQGLDTTEGLLLFGKEHFYVLDGFTLVNGREVHDINFIPTTYYEPIIPQVPGQTRPSHKRHVMKYAYDGVKEVHKRRYLLQPIAVEVFCADGQTQLLAFMKDVRSKVFQRFLSVSTNSIVDNAQTSVAGQRLSASVEQSGGLFSSLMGETSVTQRWVRGEITNFQYLMALNTLAGRSYNDLMQYPIFPWVLADYSSEDEPDLNEPATFRDLSKPMGAQTSQRLDQFKKRFNDWDDPHGDTPPYHYGTHYSSAMIVSSYLVRMEPFTQHFLHLQGGHFDLADRMFHSIEEAWCSASKNNMADVRELIPEFFYLPDFLENRNNFDIGVKQNGQPLHDVLLPPWAKGSAAEFIRIHRAALESDYVSKRLHEWIDLIFGYKQHGPAAVEAVNVFHHLFYEGNVDIFSIEDPLKRNATIGFINNFGQTPKQLFRKPHPAKSDAAFSTTFSQDLFFHNLTNMRPSVAPIKELKGPVGQIQQSERGVLAVEQNKVLVPGNSNRYLAWGYADQSFRLGNYESDKAVFVCEPSYLIGQVLTCVCPNAKEVLTAGTSSVVMVYDYDKRVRQLLIKKLLYGHTDAVICLAASQAWSIAVSGSRDKSAIIWDLSRFEYIKHLPGHIGPVATVAINDLTGDIVTCAGAWLYVWDIGGRPLACLDTNAVCPPLSPQPKQQQILCVACSQMNEWDRENVIMTGSSDGVVRMWSLDLVEVSAQDDARASSEEGFVVVDEKLEAPVRSPNDGYTWRRQLVFRAKLTMHTAFERPDNVEPAAVTALSVSKDHRTVYVGDERGRVFSWSVASKPGKGMVDHWMKDEGAGACVDCGVKFTIYERRHHCRSCGKVFCSSCTQYQAEIPRLKIMQPVRVCKLCHDALDTAAAAAAAATVSKEEETSPKKK